MTTGTTPALAAPTAPTPADLAPAVNPVDARTALALLGLPNAYELDTPALNAAAARALEAARIMRTTRQAIEAMCRTGLLPAYQLPDNGHWRIRRTGFDTIRARLNHGRTAPEPTTATVPRSHRSRRRSRTTNKTTPAPVSSAGA